MTELLRNGPKAGRHWGVEVDEYTDPNSGATVRRLTDYPGSDNRHLYFTEPGWYDGGDRLLIRPYRDDVGGEYDIPSEGGVPRQVYSLDLRSGLLTQLSDIPDGIDGMTRSYTDPEAYFWSDDRLGALDLRTLEVRTLYESPDGFSGAGTTTATADGEAVCAIVREPVEGDHSERSAARPTSKIVEVPLDGGEVDVLHEEAYLLSHANASPGRPELMTFCHEGPWDEVDHRIWGLDRETGEVWKIRPQEDDVSIGHEYWHADGETLGYHGWRGSQESPDPFFGHVRYDNTEQHETSFSNFNTHFHSLDGHLVVGDGSHRGIPYNLLWRWDEATGEYDGPRILATTDWRNGGRSGPGTVHPHSQFSPDGETVAFDSDRNAPGSDVYLVDVPPFEELPVLESVSE
jgi:oligogalacturonide lyase